MAGEIISERRATSNRNGGRDHPGIPGDFSRNQHHGFPREEECMIRNFRALPSPLSEKDGAPRRDRLRQLAAWYRAQAERAGSLWVWEARLQRAEDLEAQAAALERFSYRFGNE